MLSHQVMKRQTIEPAYVRTLDWFNDTVVDWNSAGTAYSLDGTQTQLQKYHFGFVCDGAISSPCGTYALIYQKLGTKGLLLKNGELLREINRSYYQSSAYEFPAAFWEYKGRTYLIHCPREYCMIDIEEVETGILITNIEAREPTDVFHSRLEVSPDNKYLLSKGWVWHPWNIVEYFDLEKCFEQPTLLDKGTRPEVDGEVFSATFFSPDKVLVLDSDEIDYESNTNTVHVKNTIQIWNLKTNKIEHTVELDGPVGNLFPIDDKRCWDLYSYPKIFDLKTGKILEEDKDLFSGRQNSSIIRHLDNLPRIAFNQKTRQLALTNENCIEVLTP